MLLIFLVGFCSDTLKPPIKVEIFGSENYLISVGAMPSVVLVLFLFGFEITEIVCV